MKEPTIMSFESSCDADEPWPWILDPSLQTYSTHPLVDADSAWVLAPAVGELASVRCPALGMADALADLHATVSLLRQGRAFLPDVVADARAQDRSWVEIAAQLQITPTAVQRRYGAR
ncbi:MAG: hypothetical protein ACYDEY_15745 [Acidimicrobiales bacterium]